MFEDVFQRSLKVHNQLTEDDRINYFHSLLKENALQTFKIITSPFRGNLGEFLSVFSGKYFKTQSKAAGKHKYQKVVFIQANQKLVYLLKELHWLAWNAFGKVAHAIIEQFKNAKMSTHSDNFLNRANLENGTYEQTLTDLDEEIELNGFEAPNELQVNTVSQTTTNTNVDRPERTCH